MIITHPEIKPVIVGRLECQDQFGNWHDRFTKVYFQKGFTGGKGEAMADTQSDIYGRSLLPIRKVVSSRFGQDHYEPLVFEGWAGLSCRYDRNTGTLSDFYEE